MVNAVVRFRPQFGQITYNTIIILEAINSTTISVYNKTAPIRPIYSLKLRWQIYSTALFQYVYQYPKIQSVSIFSVVIVCVFVAFFFCCLFLSIQFKFTLKISKIQLNLNINFKSVHIYQFQFDVELKTPLEIRYIYRPPKIDGK